MARNIGSGHEGDVWFKYHQKTRQSGCQIGKGERGDGEAGERRVNFWVLVELGPLPFCFDGDPLTRQTPARWIDELIGCSIVLSWGRRPARFPDLAWAAV